MNDQAMVTYHREGHIGYLTLNRPDKRNAMSLAFWHKLGDVIDEAAVDDDARVVILRGAGKSFCAGLELSPDNELFSHLMSPDGATAANKTKLYHEIRRVQNIHTAFERLPMPTIASIHKHCLGAGLELALCADIRLCSADAVFSLPEAKLAFITDVGGLQRLRRLVGAGRAKEISYRGHRFGTDYAERIGLVNEVYPDKEALDAAALGMAEEIAANAPLAVRGAKDVFLFDEESTMEDSLDYNCARSVMILPSEDINEAVTAYLEGRPGKFKGA